MKLEYCTAQICAKQIRRKAHVRNHSPACVCYVAPWPQPLPPQPHCAESREPPNQALVMKTEPVCRSPRSEGGLSACRRGVTAIMLISLGPTRVKYTPRTVVLKATLASYLSMARERIET